MMINLLYKNKVYSWENNKVTDFFSSYFYQFIANLMKITNKIKVVKTKLFLVVISFVHI